MDELMDERAMGEGAGERITDVDARVQRAREANAVQLSVRPAVPRLLHLDMKHGVGKLIASNEAVRDGGVDGGRDLTFAKSSRIILNEESARSLRQTRATGDNEE
jgi:hypothetical protein